MTVMVQACLEADFNAATQTCAAPLWVPQESSFPTLSIPDAQSIGLSMALLLATAWVARQAKKALATF